MRLLIAIAVSATYFALSAREADAATVSILNPGFETPVLADGVSSSAPPNWSAGTFSGFSLNPSPSDMVGGVAPEGQNIGMSVSFGGALKGALDQILTATLTAGATYTLTVDVGHPIPNAPAFGAPITYAGYEVVLLAGGVTVAQDNTTISIPLGEFRTSTTTYTAPLSGPLLGLPLEIQLLTPGTTTFNGAYFDNVRLNATVPEPSTWVLAIIGLTSLIAGARRGRS